MLEKINVILSRYDELQKLLEDVGNDYQKAGELAKEKSELDAVVIKANEYKDTLQKLDEARDLQSSEDEDLRQLALIELEEMTPRVTQLENELKGLLIPKDKRDERNVIMEIRAGPGGDEAALFAADLFRLYSYYADHRGWKVETMSQSEIGIGGFKEIIFMVKGRGAYSRLKFESGVHRVQRIPTTESSGRIHTSTVSVVVMAEVEDVDIHIPDSDIKMDVFRSAGAGGQNVQKNSTAIRLTHFPTGIVVACQDERSQLQNRLRAMSILRARLFEIEETRRQHELEVTRRAQVGSGERSEKIRTYNYPQSRVTDHRINLSSFNLSAVMEGDIDMFIDELSLREESDRLATIGAEAEEDA